MAQLIVGYFDTMFFGVGNGSKLANGRHKSFSEWASISTTTTSKYSSTHPIISTGVIISNLSVFNNICHEFITIT